LGSSSSSRLQSKVQPYPYWPAHCGRHVAYVSPSCPVPAPLEWRSNDRRHKAIAHLAAIAVPGKAVTCEPPCWVIISGEVFSGNGPDPYLLEAVGVPPAAPYMKYTTHQVVRGCLGGRHRDVRCIRSGFFSFLSFFLPFLLHSNAPDNPWGWSSACRPHPWRTWHKIEIHYRSSRDEHFVR